jgi:hypothetical protein
LIKWKRRGEENKIKDGKKKRMNDMKERCNVKEMQDGREG